MRTRPQIWLLIGLAAYLGLGLTFMQAVPPFENSDEAEHFLHAHWIASTGQLPLIRSREQLRGQADPIARWNNQAHHPPLYYLLSAVLIAPLDRGNLPDYLISNDLIFVRGVTDGNPNKWLHPPQRPPDQTGLAIRLLRWVNLFLGAFTLLLIARCARIIGVRPGLALASIAGLPTFVIVHSSVSNDPLLILLMTAGVLWCLRLLAGQQATWQANTLIGLICAGAALTKITGLALLGGVGLALLLARLQGRINTRDLVRTSLIIGLCVASLAGWWYARNLQLYGDPLAVAAVQSVWGRGPGEDLAQTVEAEALRIARSFWMMIGYSHQPVFAPDAYYRVALASLALALAGWVRRWFSQNLPGQAVLWGWLGLYSLGVAALVIYGTRSVDISYGRLFFPALAPLALVLAGGWGAWGRWAGMPVLVLGAGAIFLAVRVAPQAYPLATPAHITDQTTPLGWSLDSGLTLAGVEMLAQSIEPGGSLPLDIIWQGAHPANPALLIQAIDALDLTVRGRAEVYPGLAPTNQDDTGLYRARVYLPIAQPVQALPPRLLSLELTWQDPVGGVALPFISETALVPAAVLVDERYARPTPAVPASARFGDDIVLTGYTLTVYTTDDSPHADLHLLWQTLGPTDEEWSLTVQVLAEDGTLITQADGPAPGLPSPHWPPDLVFDEVRTLTLPAGLPAGEYPIALGWYRLSDFARASIIGGPVRDDLYLLPDRLVIP